MDSYLVDMVLCGIAYVIIVYFMMKLVRPERGNSPKDDNEDGGIYWDTLPDLDLPPGVSLPDGSTPRHVIQPEEEPVA